MSAQVHLCVDVSLALQTTKQIRSGAHGQIKDIPGSLDLHFRKRISKAIGVCEACPQGYQKTRSCVVELRHTSIRSIHTPQRAHCVEDSGGREFEMSRRQ